MDHRKVMGEIWRIVAERCEDGGMWKGCGMKGNHDQWLHTP